MTENNSFLQSPDELKEKEQLVIKVVIACEDTYIVKQYFDRLKKRDFWKEFEGIKSIYFNSEVLTPKTHGENKAKDIQDRIIEHIQRDEPLDTDSYWLVIDRDIETDTSKLDDLSAFCKKSKATEEVKVNLANTNPCFAFWLFLHYHPADHSLINNFDECQPIEKLLTDQNYPFQLLKNKGKELKRNKEITLEMLITAVQHAKAIEITESHPDDWLKNPRTTQVHRIFLHHLPEIFG